MSGTKAFVWWFGDLIEMEVVGFDQATGQHQVKHINAFGSFYTKLKKAKGIYYEKQTKKTP